VTERLPAFKPRRLIRVLEQKGWKLHRVKGSHHVFVHPTNPKLITVAVHSGDLKRGLVAGVLKDAGISREEFLRLL
jgi:predicted RNA binding protein YcfA (HicA-like mRNA interferase family)